MTVFSWLMYVAAFVVVYLALGVHVAGWWCRIRRFAQVQDREIVAWIVLWPVLAPLELFRWAAGRFLKK